MSANEDIDKLIRTHVVLAMVGGLMPIPMIDIAAVTTVQLDLVRKLADKYGQDFSETQARAAVSALAGSVGARLAVEGLKFIPGFGSIAGGLTMSALSGATTYAIGQVFVRHFSGGGTVLDFDPARFRDFFREQFERGKDYVRNYARKPRKPKKIAGLLPAPLPKEDDVLSRLGELGRLRDEGILSEDEFQRLKQQILSEVL